MEYILTSFVYDTLIEYHKKDNQLTSYYSTRIAETKNDYIKSFLNRKWHSESNALKQQLGYNKYKYETIDKFRSILVSKNHAIGKVSEHHMPFAWYVFGMLFDDLQLQVFERTEKIIQLVEKFKIFYQLNIELHKKNNVVRNLTDRGSTTNIIIRSILNDQSEIWTDPIGFITNNVMNVNDILKLKNDVTVAKNVNIMRLVVRYIASVYNMRNTSKLYRLSSDSLVKHLTQAIRVHHANCLEKITVWDEHDSMCIHPTKNGVKVTVQKGYKQTPDTKPLTPNKANYTMPRWYSKSIGSINIIFKNNERG